MSEEPSGFVQVMVTAPDVRSADAIGKTALEKRLCGCVQRLGPLRSQYHWQGTVEEADEHLLIFKTRASLATALQECVVAVHPYDVPEVLVMPVLSGHPAYLQWLSDATQPPVDQ